MRCVKNMHVNYFMYRQWPYYGLSMSFFVRMHGRVVLPRRRSGSASSGSDDGKSVAGLNDEQKREALRYAYSIGFPVATYVYAFHPGMGEEDTGNVE